MSPRICRDFEVCGLWNWYRVQVAEDLGVDLVWKRRKANVVSTRHDTVFVTEEAEEEAGKEHNDECEGDKGNEHVFSKRYLYTLATGIGAWLQERAEHEQTVKELSETISQIQNVLLPLKTICIDKPVLDSVRSIGDALKRTKEHLLVWQYKRTHQISSRLFPSTALGQLKRDAQRLNQQLVLLLTSLAIAQYSHSHSSPSAESESESESSVIAPATRNPTVLDWVDNRDVREFWRGYVGERIQFVSELEFRRRLTSWLGETPSLASFGRLMLRLDEFGAGGVTPSRLDEIAAGNSLKDVLKMYMETDGPIPSTTPESKQEESQIRLPLLIWVDDKPINNITEVLHARGLGINVIQFISTALAKSWIEEHDDFLRRNDDPSLIRFISDNHRDEYGINWYLNHAAGENILRYLRGRHYNIPVLIFTGKSIYGTRYVTDYHLAGSSVCSIVCCRYISSLALGGTDDFGWMEFMA